MTQIYENILCRKFYGGSIDETDPTRGERCKDDRIQSELAYLLAVTNALGAAVSCLVAMPWGLAADR